MVCPEVEREQYVRTSKGILPCAGGVFPLLLEVAPDEAAEEADFLSTKQSRLPVGVGNSVYSVVQEVVVEPPARPEAFKISLADQCRIEGLVSLELGAMTALLSSCGVDCLLGFRGLSSRGHS